MAELASPDQGFEWFLLIRRFAHPGWGRARSGSWGCHHGHRCAGSANTSGRAVMCRDRRPPTWAAGDGCETTRPLPLVLLRPACHPDTSTKGQDGAPARESWTPPSAPVGRATHRPSCASRLRAGRAARSRERPHDARPQPLTEPFPNALRRLTVLARSRWISCEACPPAWKLPGACPQSGCRGRGALPFPCTEGRRL